MYSKQGGVTPRTVPRSPRPPRTPAYRQRIRVPPNYGGNAIVDGEERLPVAEGVAETVPPPEGPIPHFEDLPRVREGEQPDGLPRGGGRPSPTLRGYGAHAADGPTGELPRLSTEKGDDSPAASSTAVSATGPVPPLAPSSRPAGRLFSLFDSTRFPFGHGLGFDELLLLGLILFLSREGDDSRERGERGDLDETLLLLGLLLLWG